MATKGATISQVTPPDFSKYPSRLLPIFSEMLAAHVDKNTVRFKELGAQVTDPNDKLLWKQYFADCQQLNIWERQQKAVIEAHQQAIDASKANVAVHTEHREAIVHQRGADLAKVLDKGYPGVGGQQSHIASTGTAVRVVLK